MKKTNNKSRDKKHLDMRPEYDFSNMPGGVRGKYYKAYRTGHTVKIHRADGTTLVQYFTLKDGSVMLDPDLRAYFPDSKSVNKVLRCLVPLLPKKREVKVAKAAKRGSIPPLPGKCAAKVAKRGSIPPLPKKRAVKKKA